MPMSLLPRVSFLRRGGVATAVVVIAIVSAGLLCWPVPASAPVPVTGSAR